MIHIQDKHACCGCSACEQICPRQCIVFKADEEGFMYPVVNQEACIECGLCERVCPVLNHGDNSRPLKTFAAMNRNKSVRAASSSGGIFTALAEKTVNEGGKVYGARFNDTLGVEHCGADDIDGIASFRGSKYLQSTMNNTFKNVRADLNKGKKVLFSGTPCQVAGLKKFLRKDYDNLTLVDFVCHGVPSPAVWQGYLHSFPNVFIDSASFRDKQEGWHRYGMRLRGAYRSDASCWHRFGLFFDDPYMQIFLANLSLRPSCYECPAKAGRSGSDLTLGDFWGIEQVDPAVDDDRGTSLVIVNSAKGEALLQGLDIKTKEEPHEEAVKYNPSIEVSVAEPEARAKFFRVFAHSGFNDAYKATMIPPLSRRVIRKIKNIARRILGSKGRQIVNIIRGR